MSGATVSADPATNARQRVSAAPRRAFVRRAVTEWKLRHPELRDSITVDGVMKVFSGADIRVHRRPYGHHLGAALAIPVDLRDPTCDEVVRLVILDESLEGTALLHVALHELAHHALHLTIGYLRARIEERRRSLRQPATEREQAEDARFEAEADYFAELLLGAPSAAIARQQLDALELAA
jgi:hypothetical protein